MLMNMLNAINNALDLGMQEDPGVVVLGEDVGKDGGVFRVTDGLLDKHPNQVFDTPLAEDGIIGMSVGMALAGMHPVP
ncbi:MAG: alpha-ketoacid dehydrogenase subunit beta, partial [Candidatus Marsarchaeota archaeon]|nr:alpha-ketoacid dehydrogenase subunit beta [Candidatus Marsarchaeota archaeon]